jgi:endoglucanase Acf2
MSIPAHPLQRRLAAATALLLSSATLGLAADAADGVVRVGPGGYLTEPPKHCKPLNDRIYKTADVSGPTLTGQWWSSLVWLPFSQPLFAHPMSMRCVEGGLTVDYPGSKITANDHGIFGSGASKDGDLRLGHSAITSFAHADCAGYSDWFVTASFASGEAWFKASFGHGSPYIYGTYTGGRPTVTFAKAPTLWSGGTGDAVLGITINHHHYGLFGASGSAWKTDGTTWINEGTGRHLAIALLPDDRPETLALFGKHAYSHVIDTRVEYQVVGGTLNTTYRLITEAMEGIDQGTLFALYPHQWKYATSRLGDQAYGSVRGTMRLAAGHSFTTAVPIQGVLPMFPAEGVQDQARMVAYLAEEAAKKPAGYGDTYWEGKHLGRLATLSGIAEVCGEAALQKRFVDEIKRRLEDWFTARPGKDQPVFYYNAAWGSLIGSRPSYGSDRPLNDHHFHYGYFIRAAGEVARVDPAWARTWAPMVRMVIRDIASIDRQDELFPYLRCFDKYAGHSWASGDANFADGNNQESSSESLNAWYGMILWGAATGDTVVRDAGLFLFNTERTAVEEYWFDASGTNYPETFTQVALGMVWGGKGAFGTWFSADIDCIHGINWLPFTPASIYMGRSPQYVKKNHDRIVEKRKGGKDYNNGWGDLVAMFGALQDPTVAAGYIDATPACKLEDGNSHAFMYHWIYTLKNLGLNDASVTADHPLVNVFIKDGVKTYVAYNTQDTPLVVTFSDGTRLTAEPRKLTIKR